jgi:hypothetical protein
MLNGSATPLRAHGFPNCMGDPIDCFEMIYENDKRYRLKLSFKTVWIFAWSWRKRDLGRLGPLLTGNH